MNLVFHWTWNFHYEVVNLDNTLNIGIIDDDKSKVTQIMIRLQEGLDGASPEKKEKYASFVFNPIELELLENIPLLLTQVREKKLDCVLIDYKLSSFEIVDYTGVDIAKALEMAFYEFPIFILTSYEDDLFNNEIYNAYQVFDFDRYLSESSERIELNYKMIEQVLKYRKQREKWQAELKNLLPHSGKSEEIDSRILQLDTCLEKSIDGEHAISEKTKKDLSSNKIVELIDKIDDILKKE